MTQVVEHLSRNCHALSSIPSTAKKNRKRERERERSKEHYQTNHLCSYLRIAENKE
jgi:hypothetical protein